MATASSKTKKARLYKHKPTPITLPCGKVLTVIGSPDGGHSAIEILDPPGCTIGKAKLTNTLEVK